MPLRRGVHYDVCDAQREALCGISRERLKERWPEATEEQLSEGVDIVTSDLLEAARTLVIDFDRIETTEAELKAVMERSDGSVQ